MNTLPSCIHRGTEASPEHYPCATDRLRHSGIVSASTCRRCPYANVPRRESQGFGDTVHRVTHALRIDAVVGALGIDCGCAGRKQRLNELFPTAETPHPP
jgi:hypothetical protein